MKPLNFPYLYKTLIFALTFGCTQNIFGQQSIQLKNRITQLNEVSKNKPEFILQTNNNQTKGQVYLKFSSPPNHKLLSQKGVVLESYVGDNTYLSSINKNTNLQELNGVIAWADIEIEDKISSHILNVGSSEIIQAMVVFAKGADTANVKKDGVTFANEQPWTLQNNWIINASVQKLVELAKNPSILYISPKPEDQNLNGKAQAYSNGTIVKSKTGYNLDGTGIVIGVGDDSYPTHIDLMDRTTNFNPQLFTSHGEHVAGTAVGAGLKDEYFEGFAPKADLLTNYFSRIIAYAPQYESNFNMKVTNNSYAAIVGDCGYAGTYDATSQYMDQLALNNPELINVFAAGNDGGMTCGSFPARYGTVVGSYQAAKNTLVVGMIGKHEDNLSNLGSCGPLKDGRLKPEIVVAGYQVYSSGFNNQYYHSTGTSMACPNVSGAAVLLQQRFKALHSGQYPSNVLLKAILMNSATDIGNPGPDYINGFGKMNVGAAIAIIDNNRYLSGTVTNGSSQMHTISVPANLGQLKIMLHWNDAPASPSNTKALVNDIDLSVTSPTSAISLPLVLNHDPAFVTQIATPGIDRLNNVEQVVIQNPVAGNYTINVNSFNIPSGAQDYIITYAFVDKEIEIFYPVADVKIESDTSILVHWDVLENTTDFTVSYSIDNGVNWQNIGTVAANKRYTTWTPPAGTASDKCMLRVSRTDATATVGPFVVLSRPVATLSASQCPGNIQLEWNAIAGADKYYVYKKVGAEMKLIDSTNALQYTYGGLHQDSIYWIAIAPVINFKPGMRSVAVTRKPFDGNCATISEHGDLALVKIINAKDGRLHTSTSFGTNAYFTAIIRNQDNVAANNYRLSYQVNNGSWQSHIINTTIAPTGQATASFVVNNINIPGIYNIDVAITNLSVVDPNTNNDTLHFTVQQFNNNPIDLTTDYLENFETLPLIATTQTTGGLGVENRYDFGNTNSTGRLRSYVQNEVLIEGNHSISLDNTINHKNNVQGSSFNTLIGTYNLSNYNVSVDEVRFEFDYILHGKVSFDTANKVFVRGADTDNWISLPIFDTNTVGVVNRYGAYSLRDLFLANGQTFSTSSQIKIMQRDISIIGGVSYGKGLTIDNIHLFKASNDIAIIDANQLNKFNCGMSNNVPLTVKVANTMPHNQSNIPIFYKINNQTVVSAIIPSIAAKDTITYTFAQTMDLSTPGAYNLNVWVAMPGDSYSNNDSLVNLVIHNQPVIASFPYYEGFESNEGFYFTDGINSSWEYGNPGAININHAANGTKAWKTNLLGSYNANEESYLYSPCFDLSSLSQPMLSFSMIYEIEGLSDRVYDSAFVEYTIDGGANWQRLGQFEQGYNWYNNSNNAWIGTDKTYWQVVSIALPNVPSLSLRWVLHTDEGSQFAGIGVDDIHIFDYQKPIFDDDSLSSALTANLISTHSFEGNGKISGIIDPLSQSFGNISYQTYKHANFIEPDSQQFFLPRSFSVKAPDANNVDSFWMQLFVKDSMMNVLRNTTLCTSCTSHPKEVYQLGVTTYTDADWDKVNGTLDDNNNGVFKFITNDKVTWIPYFDGYYARFKTDQIGEYWFNDGGITKVNPLPLITLDFKAVKIGDRNAKITWKSKIDDQVMQYQLQHNEGNGFVSLNNQNSINNPNQEYEYVDTPMLTTLPYVLYRLKYTLYDGSILYSPIEKLQWDNLSATFDVYPNPTTNGEIYFKWYNNTDEGFDWAIYNLIGQKVSSGWIDQNRFAGIEKISIKHQTQVGDTYYLKVKFKNKTQTFKILYQPE